MITLLSCYINILLCYTYRWLSAESLLLIAKIYVYCINKLSKMSKNLENALKSPKKMFLKCI